MTREKITGIILLLSTLLSSSTLPEGYNSTIQGGNISETQVSTYPYPRIMERSFDFTLRANGQEVTILQTSAGPFAAFSCDGPVTIEVTLPGNTSNNLHVSPLRLGIQTEREGNTLVFQIPGPQLMAIMIDLLPALYIYANPIKNNKPDPNDPDVIFFAEGQVYEVADMKLQSNQTVYIEGGAVVRGCFHAVSAENIRIAGYGVLDGSFFNANDRRWSIMLEDCKNSIIEDIIMIEPTSWMIVLNHSEHIAVNNVKQLGYVSTSDGVDIVGSRHIRITNSFLRNGDDCVAIKAFDTKRYSRHARFSGARNVYDVEVSGCILVSYKGGHAFEIGHELTTDSIYDIRFRDCDVLGIHDMGGVFGINNTDGATVTDILYEDIRVEHYYNKLINLRLVKSRYFSDKERGQVRNITFRNIDVTNSRYNAGYSVSLIGGYNENHTVEDVLFENFYIGGKKATTGDYIYLFTTHTKGIRFR